MGTKMKGLLKGLKYITHKFEDGKEQDMQIGFPTDVKHVAHIGWDGGPSVDSPSWMKDYTPPHGFQSAPLNANGQPMTNPEIKWISEDSSRRSLRLQNSTAQEMPELPKSSKRLTSIDNSTTSESTKSRQSRKNSSNGSKQAPRQPKEVVVESEDSSVQSVPPDVRKKTRRKKSKESEGGGSSRSSRSKANAPIGNTSLQPDPEVDTKSITGSAGNNEFLSQSSSLETLVKEGD